MFAEQLYDVIGDVVWDVNFSNFDIIFGDDDVKFKPFTFDSLQITSAGDPTTKVPDDKLTDLTSL